MNDEAVYRIAPATPGPLIMQFNQMSPVNLVSGSRGEGVSLELTHNIG